MKHYWSIVLMLIFISGCAPGRIPVDLPAYLSPKNLDDLQLSQLYLAADEWYEASAGKFDLIGDKVGKEVPVIDASLKAYGAYGSTDYDEESITFDGMAVKHDSAADGFDAENVYRGIFVHEIGHLLGLSHMPDTVMDPIINRYNPRLCIDVASIRIACHNYGSCPDGWHSTCDRE